MEIVLGFLIVGAILSLIIGLIASLHSGAKRDRTTQSLATMSLPELQQYLRVDKYEWASRFRVRLSTTCFGPETESAFEMLTEKTFSQTKDPLSDHLFLSSCYGSMLGVLKDDISERIEWREEHLSSRRLDPPHDAPLAFTLKWLEKIVKEHNKRIDGHAAKDSFTEWNLALVTAETYFENTGLSSRPRFIVYCHPELLQAEIDRVTLQSSSPPPRSAVTDYVAVRGSDKARVYLYCPDAGGVSRLFAGNTMSMRCDGLTMATVKPGSYAVCRINPGPHTLEVRPPDGVDANKWPGRPLTFDLVPGQECFLRCVNAVLEPVIREHAESEIAVFKEVESEWVGLFFR